MRNLLFILILSSGSSLMAAQSLECHTIQDPQERLGCYDRQFPQSIPPSPGVETDQVIDPAEKIETNERNESAESIDTSATNDEMKSDSIVTGQEVPPELPAREPREAGNQDDPEESRGVLGRVFGRGEDVEVSGRIRELLNRDKQKMVFLLENGEVWIQNNPRNLPIRAGEAVTIKSTLTGGYMLRTTDGISTRVSRVE
jgi:hypothetical protein